MLLKLFMKISSWTAQPVQTITYLRLCFIKRAHRRTFLKDFAHNNVIIAQLPTAWISS